MHSSMHKHENKRHLQLWQLCILVMDAGAKRVTSCTQPMQAPAKQGSAGISFININSSYGGITGNLPGQ